MDSRKLLQLTVLLLALVGIIVVANKLSGPRQSAKDTKFFPTFTEANCASILIAQGPDSVRLSKRGDVWMESNPTLSAQSANALQSTPSAVERKREYPADSALAATALEKLGKMTRGELLSQNVEKQSLFEVDSARGTYVEAFDGKGVSLGAILIGKNGADWSSAFVRAMGSNNVYSVGGNVKSSFFADRKRWRNKLVMKFDESLAEKIVLAKQGGTTISLEKKSDTTVPASWRLVGSDSGTVLTDKVNEILSAASNLHALDYEEQALSDSAMGFAAPELVLNISLKGGSMRRLIVGRKKETSSNQFWVRTNDKPYTFLVEDFTIQKFDKNVNGLKGIEEKTSPAKPKRP